MTLTTLIFITVGIPLGCLLSLAWIAITKGELDEY